MVLTVMTVCWRRLMHNRIELLLAFIVPIAFFSIFALIFGSGVGAGANASIKVVGVDTVRSEQSRMLLQVLHETPGLRFVDDAAASPGLDATPPASPSLTRREATTMVRRGTATIAILIRRHDDGSLAADLLSDASDQVAPQVVSALVNQVLGRFAAYPSAAPPTTAPPTSSLGGVAVAPAWAAVGKPPKRLPRPGEVTANVPPPSDSLPPVSSAAGSPLGESALTTLSDPTLSHPTLSHQGVVQAAARVSQPISPPPPIQRVEIVDLLGGQKSNPVVTMYAAGIAVMFLLFGATSGGGTLLEERENQTLDRLLTTGLSMDQLLLGKWAYLTVLGILQTTLMFVWGQLVFGVDLLGHLDGFLIITGVTSGAAAAFGLLLATLCRTRGQLNGLSVVVVLTMSALGGSMVPRYVMSQSLRDAGLWTFNAWALDGYDKVFWRELPVGDLWPQMSVLMVCGAAFLVTARALAVRWEAD